MKIIDQIKVYKLRKQLLQNKKKLSNITELDMECLFYYFPDGQTLMDAIFEYKKDEILPLSKLNIDFNDDRVVSYMFKYFGRLSEDELFIVSNGNYFIQNILANDNMTLEYANFIIKNTRCSQKISRM